MKADIKTKWLAALRSGDYKQGKGMLKYENIAGEMEYCCLGVLCELAIADGVHIDTREEYIESDGHDGNFPCFGGAYSDPDKKEADEVLPPEVAEWAGIEKNIPVYNFRYEGHDVQKDLATLNDAGWFQTDYDLGTIGGHQTGRFDFQSIANVIEFGEEVK